jgi:hypothetical protein
VSNKKINHGIRDYSFGVTNEKLRLKYLYLKKIYFLRRIIIYIRLKALKIKNNGGKVMPTENIKISEVGFKGIYKSGLNFRVRISINGINRDLGTFPNIELANERYLEAKKLISESKSIEHFYSKKHPNKIYKGVFKNGDKYQAKLTVNGKLNNLGSYDSPESARDVYEKAVALLNQGRDIEHLIKRKKRL